MKKAKINGAWTGSAAPLRRQDEKRYMIVGREGWTRRGLEKTIW